MNTRPYFLKQLRELNVDTVTAHFEGKWGSGQIDYPRFGFAKVPPDLASSVRDLFYDLLEEHCRDWEINEGSSGSFVWDLKTDNLELTHAHRIECFQERLWI